MWAEWKPVVMTPFLSLSDADGRRIVTGSGERLEVEVLDPSGSLERIARVPDYPLGLSDEEIDAILLYIEKES